MSKNQIWYSVFFLDLVYIDLKLKIILNNPLHQFHIDAHPVLDRLKIWLVRETQMAKTIDAVS